MEVTTKKGYATGSVLAGALRSLRDNGGRAGRSRLRRRVGRVHTTDLNVHVYDDFAGYFHNDNPSGDDHNHRCANDHDDDIP